jgi:hypothetical protein
LPKSRKARDGERKEGRKAQKEGNAVRQGKRGKKARKRVCGSCTTPFGNFGLVRRAKRGLLLKGAEANKPLMVNENFF